MGEVEIIIANTWVTSSSLLISEDKIEGFLSLYYTDDFLNCAYKRRLCGELMITII